MKNIIRPNESPEDEGIGFVLFVCFSDFSSAKRDGGDSNKLKRPALRRNATLASSTIATKFHPND